MNKDDHCTAVPDRWKSYDMSGCCLIHDEDYAAGTKTRLEADIDFYWCLRRVAPHWIAVAYYVGVRAFGWIFYQKR